MPRNIEAKFRDVDLHALRDAALAMGADDRGELRQADTFFRCANGRLKLRDFGTGVGELICYSRPDATASRASDYQISRTAEPDTLLEVLEIALGVVGRVRKRRNLLLWRNVRIHLDQIDGLGDFAELESVIGEAADEATARANLDAVIDGLGLRDATRVAVAYVDLIAAGG
jgi:predicted adenylyl cyclase CyaB